MIVHDSHGLPFRRYGEDVFHCVRCHRLVCCYDLNEEEHYLAALAMHNEVWHSDGWQALWLANQAERNQT